MRPGPCILERALTDIFSELEEDIRRDRLKQLWQKYGQWFVGFAVLCVAAAGGYVWWQSHVKAQADTAAESFEAASALIASGNVDAAVAAYGAIASGAGGYAHFATLRQAALTLEKGDQPGAVALYDKLAASDADDRIKAVARIRAAYASVDVETPDALKNRVATLAGDADPWRFAAREIMAIADIRAGRRAEALAAFDALIADEAAPPALKERARRLAAWLRGGAVIPPPPKPPQAEAPAAPDPAEGAAAVPPQDPAAPAAPAQPQ